MRMRQHSFDRVLSALLTASCVIMVVVVLQRQFQRANRVGANGALPTLKINNWDSVLAHATALSSIGGKVRIEVFSDFECPGCRLFSSTLRSVQERFGSAVS